MKKFISVLCTVFIIGLVLAGCAKDKPTSKEVKSTAEPNASSDESASHVEPIEFKFHTPNPSKTSRLAIDLFISEIEKNSNGQIVVDAYTNGELYSNDEDQLVACQTGAVQGVMTGDMVLSWAAPEWISYTSVPFAFSSNDQFFKFFLGEKGAEINVKLEDNYNMHFLDSAIGARGGRMLTANKPVTTPADMAGLKFRVPNVIGTVASWEAMGAKVTGVAWSELFTSLQSGLVDAQENPYAQIEGGGFYQVQNYIMETSHQIGPQIFVVNIDFWNQLTPELQKVFNNANKVACDIFNEKTADDDERIKQKILADGSTKIIPVEEIDIAAFVKLIGENVITNEEITKDWAPGGWEYIQSLK